jgi:hypothetical protein
MDPLTIIVLAIISTVGAALFIHFRKVYFVGPKLTIELIPNGGMSRICGLSIKNDASKGTIDADKAIHVFEFTWEINLIITNNSAITAHYPKLNFLKQQLGFTAIENFDKHNTIEGNEQIVLKATYQKFKECARGNCTPMKDLPAHMNDLKILLEYKNTVDKIFYTKFNNADVKHKNKYTLTRPSAFSFNSHL